MCTCATNHQDPLHFATTQQRPGKHTAVTYTDAYTPRPWVCHTGIYASDWQLSLFNYNNLLWLIVRVAAGNCQQQP
jgi:hypothetical protein